MPHFEDKDLTQLLGMHACIGYIITHRSLTSCTGNVITCHLVTSCKGDVITHTRVTSCMVWHNMGHQQCSVSPHSSGGTWATHNLESSFGLERNKHHDRHAFKLGSIRIWSWTLLSTWNSNSFLIFFYVLAIQSFVMSMFVWLLLLRGVWLFVFGEILMSRLQTTRSQTWVCSPICTRGFLFDVVVRPWATYTLIVLCFASCSFAASKRSQEPMDLYVSCSSWFLS